MKKKAFFILAFLWLFTAAAAAQSGVVSEASSGSYYSYFGLGSPVSTASAQETAMGINGVSYNNYNTPGLTNPAFWGGGAYTRGSVNFNLGQYSAGDNSAASKSNLFDMGAVQLVLPLVKFKLGVSAGVYPVTRANYKSELSYTIYPGPQDTISYNSMNTGSGGVSKMEFGIGYSFNDYISVGYAPSFAFVRNNRSEDLLFLQSSGTSNFVNTKITDTAISHRFGLLLSKPAMFKRNDMLQFGAAVTLPVHFRVTSKSVTSKDINGSPQEVNLQEIRNAKVSLPLQISSGFTYFSGTYLNFSVEGSFEQWSNTEYELNKAQENNFKDRTVIGAGAQYHPYRSGSENFFSRFKYSAGISYDDGYLNVSGKDITTLWFSAGLGVLSPAVSRSSFDLSIRYGLQGTRDVNLIQEKVWLIGLSVNLTELMFNRPKLN